MKTRLVALLLLTVFVARPTMGAPLAVTREDQRDVAVTIYNGNLGLCGTCARRVCLRGRATSSSWTSQR